MKVDALYTNDGKVINFRVGNLAITENDQWTATFHNVGEQNLLFEAVSSKTPMYFTFETEKGSYEGRAIVADIDSSKQENIVTLESAGNLTQKG
ncbi:hypothetical protein [Natribacillus halophilus]|uniref:Uncharacterized protein n=1 Tax=Natribacillus halophilus TaxID=549003 RepID=A0A1G8NU53_9BACI|nr:hypothetical protein [Natribacillus halophilus]SDI83713.1 hypothetical protein SAMN04488123_10732 [Natribacillus halophilus]